MKIIILGASGYIGLRLAKKLRAQGHELHLFNRNKLKLQWLENKNVCTYDIPIDEDNRDDLSPIFKDADVVYHLIHSMSEEVSGSFHEKDIQIANFVSNISEQSNVKQIVYLGGLGNANENLSTHLESRQATGFTLSKGKTPVLELRAGVIIGAGSSSFEIVRTLATKLPFIPVVWEKEGLVEPIFVDNVLNYLCSVLDNLGRNEILEIGCGETITYAKLVQKFAKENLNRNIKILKLPFLEKIISPKLIGLVISFMTGQHRTLIIPLIYGVKNDAVVENRDINCKKVVNLELSLKLASHRERKGAVISSWDFPSNISHLAKSNKTFFTTKEKDGLLFEENWSNVENPEAVFNEIKKIGGSYGYWSPMLLWKARGIIDRMFGGPGLSSCYKYNGDIHVGSRIDFWTVEYFKETSNHRELRLRAEMKTPGEAWLQFTIDKNKQFYLRAFFEPRGILGYVYWYSLYIIHKFIFKQMVSKIILNSKVL